MTALPQLDPLIVALLRRLPPPGAPFPIREQAAFLRALSGVAEVIYGPCPTNIRVVRTERGEALIKIEGAEHE